MAPIGKLIFIIGLIFTISGAVIWLFSDKLPYIGNLPGDIKIQKENFRFYFPITTMIILSVVLSLGLWLFQKVFR